MSASSRGRVRFPPHVRNCGEGRGTSIPLSSGRRWEPISTVGVPGGTNNGFWVIDHDDPTIRARFKYLNPTKPNQSSLYSFGIERVASVLALDLGLPIPEVYLDEVEGKPGLISIRVPGNPWDTLDDETFRNVILADRNEWTTYMAFDVLVANHDRHGGNIFVEWNPPLRRRPVDGDQIALWLIDFGWSGLWPVYKFGGGLGHRDLEAVSANADLRTDYMHGIRIASPPDYRRRCALKNSDEREQALAIVRRITDDAIDKAVAEVPETYMTARAADLTRAFLRGRLARVDTLMEQVFPT